MLRLINISLSALVLCGMLPGQPPANTSCPTISVVGPAEIPNLKEPITFKALLSEEAKQYPVIFKWKAYNAEIVDGQGTSVVRVSWPDCEKNLTVEVAFAGLPEGCNGTASETTGISHCMPMPILLDEFTKSATTISKLRRDAIRKVANDNPNARVFVLQRHRENDPASTIRKRKKQVIEWLAAPDMERYTFREIPGPVNKIQFWLVPAGADIPST